MTGRDRSTPRGGLLLLAAALAACNSQDINVKKEIGELIVTPEFEDLGTFVVGDTATLEIQAVALKAPVTILGVDLQNQEGDYFALAESEDTVATLEVGATRTFTLTYTPAAAGYHWAELTLVTDIEGAERQTFQYRATAGQPAARLYPSLVDFGAVAPGEVANEVFTLVNEGASPIRLEDLSFSNPAFGVTSPLPLDVPVGEQIAVGLSFTPIDDRAAFGSATLQIPGLALPLTLSLAANDCAGGAGGAAYDADADGVGWCADDCDDSDPSVHPGATEVCDGVDQDCDGTVDDGTDCFDDDGDGFAEIDGDCNDSDASASPALDEVMGNGIDDDCNGVADAGEGDLDTDGYTGDAGDCDDADPYVHPGARETVDGLDEDCDGRIDEGTDASDDDGDGVSELDGDCNDADPAMAPGALEAEDWIDNDCDGWVDEGTTRADDDLDGFTERAGDCDDTDARRNPGEIEITGDDLDNDCDPNTGDGR